MFKRLVNSRVINWLRYVRDELQDQRLNRQLIGKDRDGNKYYQYYSYYGLPTRREIRWAIDGDWQIKDLVYYRWLQKHDFDPPTEAQKQQFYLQERQRYAKALAWDLKEKKQIEQFKKQRELLILRNAALQELQIQRNKSIELQIKSKRSE